MHRPPTIVADDHPEVALLLRNLIEDDFDVLALARDGRELVDFALSMKPQIVVTDISMPGLDGLQAARLIGRSMPDVRIVFVTVHHDAALARSALQVGYGYVLKSAAGEELIDALHAAMNSNRFVSASLRDEVLPVAPRGGTLDT